MLIVFMTAVQGLSQVNARCINLLYFFPTSLSALLTHIKNRLVDKKAFLFTAAAGVPCSLIAAFIVSRAENNIIKTLFGLFLIIVGLRELFVKS